VYYKVLFIQYIGHAEAKNKWDGEIEVHEHCGNIDRGREKEKNMVILGP